MASIQDANTNAIALLKCSGYDGDQLAATIEHVPKKKAVTKPNTVSQQILFSKASTHGEKFTVTGGGHLTSDDMFKAMAIPIRQKEIDATEKDKEFRVSMEKLEKEARGILCLPKVTDTYVGRELDILLKWYGTPSLAKLDVPSKKAEWQQILDEKREPPTYEKWTADDEDRLD